MATTKRQRHNGATAEAIGLGDLKPLHPNARKRTERSAGMIMNSLQQFGAARSIVIDEDNVVLAGNGTTEAAGVAGIERVRVVEADGNELIAVRRRGLTEQQKAALALADNRAAELAEWDPVVLAHLAAEMPDVTKGLWSAEELAALVQTNACIDAAANTGGQPIEQFMVVVTCHGEADQAEFLQRMQDEGRSCKALMS